MGDPRASDPSTDPPSTDSQASDPPSTDPPSTGRPLVLVPGACLGAWVWEDVARRLAAAGHDVHPLTLTGLADRADLATPAVDLETHIADVVSLLDDEALEHAVLVGHSYAGTVVTAVADRRPHRLDAVVYLDTGPLPDGTAIVDVQSPDQRDQQRRAVAERGGGWLWPVPDRPTLESGLFGSTAGLTDADLRTLDARATPHPFATFTQAVRLTGPPDPAVRLTGPPDPAVRLTGPAHPAVRRVAILCSAGGLDLAGARALIAAGDPRLAAFAADDWELHELATGHWPMLSLPGPLAELLHEISRTSG